MYLEADLRGDEDAEIKLSDEMDGPVLQLAGNHVDIAIMLDDHQLQKLADGLAEWGYVASNDATED